jgi:hypothetical protein
VHRFSKFVLQIGRCCADTLSNKAQPEEGHSWKAGFDGVGAVKVVHAPLTGAKVRRAKILLALAAVLFLVALDEALHGIASAWLVVFAMAMTGTAQALLLRRNRQTFN